MVVGIVNPGGTGKPIEVISARFAPFPPSNSFLVASPSVLEAPQQYVIFGVRVFFVVFLRRVAVAIGLRLHYLAQ